MRRLLCILLMLCLPLQGFAMQWGHAWQTGAGGLAHEVMHEEHVSHHHEDDGTVHVDDSDESARHIQDHSAPPQPATLHAALQPAAPVELIFPVRVEFSRYIPDPVPECPLRPPAPSLG